MEALSLLVWERLNTGHWREVWSGWRSLYGCLAAARVASVADCVTRVTARVASVDEEAVCRDLVRLCDMGLLLGGPVLGHVLEDVARLVNNHIYEKEEEDRGGKRRRKEEGAVEEVFDIEKVAVKLPPPCHQLRWVLF